MPATVYPISLARRRRWERRSLAALEPLWHDLTTALPDIVLPAAEDDEVESADFDFLLQRRVIEISDGMLVLRPYRCRSAEEAARKLVAVETRQGAALVEAVMVRSALERLRADSLPDESQIYQHRTLLTGAVTFGPKRNGCWPSSTPMCTPHSPVSQMTNPSSGLEPGRVNDSPQDHHQQPHDRGQQSQCPVRPVRSGSSRHTSYLVTGYAEARQALADPRLSKDTAAFFAGKDSKRRLHPAVAQNMLASDPPQHTRLRKLVAKAFTTGSVAALRPFIEQVIDDLLDAWPAYGQVDVVADLAMPLPVTVICELLGVPEDNRSDVQRWSADLFAAGQPERIDAASYSMAEYMTGLIAEKRDRPGNTLLDDLIRVRDGEDRLNEEELVSLAVLLLVAGHETTTNFIGSALLALLQKPADLERLRHEPDLVPGALDELLRHSSPVSMATFRYTTEPITLGGTEIPADTPVQVAIGAANRDPARFPEPGHLDFGRDATGQLSFGHGIHRCVGAPLATAEAEIALRKVLTRFPNLRLAVPPEDLVWRPTRLVQGLTALPAFV